MTSNHKKKLAIVTTHPIQYNAPFFQKLAKDETLEIQVFYTWDKGAGKKHDPGFGKAVEWDVPLLEGYPYTFVTNSSKTPGSHHYKGIVCPALISEMEAYHPDAILVYGWNFHAHLKAMRYFNGKVPVWFRGDSTLLDYDYRKMRDVWKTWGVRRWTGDMGWQETRDKRQEASPRPTPHAPRLLFFHYLKYQLRKFYLTRIYKNIDKAFYVGTNNKDYYLAHGLRGHQLVRMPHAVDNDFFSRDNEQREGEAMEWRRSLGIKDEDVVVLFAGKFEPKKNPELLVEAVIRLNEEVNREDAKTRRKNEEIAEQSDSSSGILESLNFGIHLIMVGNGILEDNLRMLANGKSYIHFLQFQNQQKMPVVYRLGDVFCIPSQGPGETWGLAMNEAMACGRPVIAGHKAGGAVDTVKAGETGWIFESNNQQDLVQTLELALQWEQTKERRLWIRNYIKKNFSIEMNAETLAGVFKLQKLS